MHSHLSSLGWSRINPRTVTHLKEVNYRLGIWQLNFTHKKTPGDSCFGWSPTIPRRVIRQPWDGHPVLPHLARVAYVWPCLAPFGPFDPVRPSLALFGPGSPVSPHFAPFRVCIGLQVHTMNI